MAEALNVGIIGASAERGWAKVSHVPAIQQLHGLKLAAVATRDKPSAEQAAAAFGAGKGYGDASDLFADPAIDIVTVAVNVPAHRDLVLGALKAGKHVYCEYPLGRDRVECELLAEAARSAGVHVAVGLQLRCNPAARRARELIDAGAIGRVLSARILSTTAAFGPTAEPAMAFAEKPENGATLLTIQSAHTIDLAITVLGDFAELIALTSTQYPRIKVEGEAAERSRITPDHLLVMARCRNSVPVSIEVVGGRPPDNTPFRFEIVGQGGTLLLEGGALRGVQSGVLRLSVDGEEQCFNRPEIASPETAVNVAGVYAALRDDIRDGTRTTPDFEQAVRLTSLIEAILSSSETGKRRQETDWINWPTTQPNC